jgi:hypothetical protein
VIFLGRVNRTTSSPGSSRDASRCLRIGAGEHIGGGVHAGRVRIGEHGIVDGLHHHAMHRFDRFYPDYGYDLS